MNKLQKLWCFAALLSTGTFFLAGFHDFRVSATNSPQVIPFSQSWTNTGLITVSDDWSGVPGIVGFRGDDLTVSTGTDPRTLVADGSATPVDVNANQTAPDSFTTGGVAEFEIANPVVALNGSGTADAPFIVLYLNTTGQSNINVQFNARDIDGSADDAIQQINTQFRVGSSGNYTNVTGGYISDATTGGTATQVTPVNVFLPASADNQAIVEVRIMTTNAIGNDEWVGIDDMSVTAGPSLPAQHVLDFNGDGKTDFTVLRNTGGGPGGALTWFWNPSGTTNLVGVQWGAQGDSFTPVDFDGDNKTDVAVWRSGVQGTFYILESSTSTLRIDNFGQTGDDPSVVDDYDGDGKADVAVYRAGLSAGQASFWYYRGSLNPANIAYVPWGQNGDFAAPGDYDGDSKADFVVQRNNGGGQAKFWMLQTTAGISQVVFGQPTDNVVPGDYDGDGKTDIAVFRGIAGQLNWFVRPSSTGTVTAAPYAIFGASATDFTAQGDYDGDGKTDAAVWRPSANPGESGFWILGSTSGISFRQWGQNGDYPVANYNRH